MPALSRTAPVPRGARRLAGLALCALSFSIAAHAADAESDRQYCERQEGIARTVCLRDLDQAKPAAAPASSVPAAAGTGASAGATMGATTAAAGGKGGDAGGTPAGFKVVGGTQVDPNTYKGFQTWRAAACDRCHGANQQGLVGPSLINSLKVLTKADFVKTVTEGRLEKGMPSFKENPTVMNNLAPLYAYLKGRSDGVITQAHVQRIQ